MRLKVAVYYPWVYLTSGAERTLLELALRSRHDITLFTSRYEPESTYPELGGVDLRVLDQVSVRRTPLHATLSGLRIVLRRPNLNDFDVLLVVCEGLGDLVVLPGAPIPAYNLCLTPLRVVFDARYREVYLSQRSPVQRAIIRLASVAFAWIDRLAWRNYTKVFPISEEVRRRILDGRLAPDSKMKIIHPGIDLDRFTPAALDDCDRTFFVPGRIMWTKNLELAIRAFRIFCDKVSDKRGWKLRIVGMLDEKSRPYLQQLEALIGDRSDVEIVLRPSDEEMDAFYRSCFGTLFTAFNEDWGLVIIEAMACAKPVIAVDRGGPTGIVRHEQDGILAECNPEAFADAMLRLAEEPGLRERLCRAAPESADRFGWGPFVDQLDCELEGHLESRDRTFAKHAGTGAEGRGL